jgi:hypothetical protein
MAEELAAELRNAKGAVAAMQMRLNQTRDQVPPGGIDDLGPVAPMACLELADGSDSAGRDRDVGGVDLLGMDVDQLAPADQDIGWLSAESDLDELAPDGNGFGFGHGRGA